MPRSLFLKTGARMKFHYEHIFSILVQLKLYVILREILLLVLQKIPSIGQPVAQFLCLSPIERRSVTSCSMVGNLSWKRRPFALLKDRRKVWANVLFLSAIMYRKVMHVNFFVSSAMYLRNHGLLRTRNFATTVKYKLFLSILKISAIFRDKGTWDISLSRKVYHIHQC